MRALSLGSVTTGMTTGVTKREFIIKSGRLNKPFLTNIVDIY